MWFLALFGMMCGCGCRGPGRSRGCVDHSKALEQPHRAVFKGSQFSAVDLTLPDVASFLFPFPSILSGLPSASSVESSPLDLRGHLIQFPPLLAATRGQRGRHLELPGTL